MTQYVYLVGSEAVQNAAGSMRAAASEMQSAANNMQCALEKHQRFLEDWLQRFTTALERK